MDRIELMRIMDKTLDDDKIGDIPVPKLLEKNSGDLESICQYVTLPKILSYIPTHQSAFDSALPRLNQVWSLEINKYVDLWRSGIAQENPAYELYRKYCFSTIDLLLKTGINNDNGLEVRWAAARGPWPLKNANNMSYRELPLCMQAVFYKLIDMIAILVKTDIPQEEQHNMFVMLKSDLRCFLSPKWNGVGGWSD